MSKTTRVVETFVIRVCEVWRVLYILSENNSGLTDLLSQPWMFTPVRFLIMSLLYVQ